MTQPSAPERRGQGRDELTVRSSRLRAASSRPRSWRCASAVARESGMGASTVYRYFPSRDAAHGVIVDATTRSGQQLRRLSRACTSRRFSRWMSVVGALRRWQWRILRSTRYLRQPGTGYRAPHTVDRQ